mmetsp:Transcript_23514/g.27225  ORF Transcript_23514/g.27225 Transcript_23514/m.27225 type:complete len:483 (-) Transcript_23514:35-1483(-)
MGIFGRKKKKEVVDEESQHRRADNISDLELAYENCLDEAGYHYHDDESCDSEGGESLPPPPPPPPPSSSPQHRSHDTNTETESHYTREEIEAPINKDPYFTADSSVDKKKDSTQRRRRRRRNKILLLVAGCVPFCIVVGLAIWYGYLYATTTNKQQPQQPQSNTYAAITSSEEPNNNTIMAMDNGAAAATFDLLPTIPQEEEEIMYNSAAASTLDSSPSIPNEEEEIGNEEDEDEDEDEGVPKSRIPEEKEKMVAHENNVPPPPPVVVVVAQQEAEVDTPATENNSVPPTVSSKQTDTSSSSNIGAATETQYIQITKQTDKNNNIGATAATIDTTETTIDGTISTDKESDSDEIMSIVLSIDSAGSVTESTICALDRIVASSHCDRNGIAVTRIFLCLGTATVVADQFWAWSDVPPAYAQVEKQDWGWVKDVSSSRGREVSGLPDGRYILGLYANGRQSSADDEVYPLLASFDFVITCGGGN